MPLVVSAEVLITEIMYAPEGADSKHEWVEVCSDSSQDILSWKFYENDTNHGLSLVSGASSMGSGECAIISDDADTFLLDYKDFSGNLFDSAFSLKNTGETISLKDDSGLVVDTITYSDSDGAKDDGNSLHRIGSILTSATPTPGNNVEATSSSGSSSVVSTTLYSYESVEIEPPQDIYLRVEESAVASIGSPIKFIAESYDATGSAVDSGSIYWSFGDGGSAYGREVQHKFLYEGSYTAVVRIESGIMFDEKTIHVEVVPILVVFVVDENKDWVSIKNKSDYSLDISSWRVMSSGQYFKIPENTIISSGNTVLFPKEITKLALFGDVFLVYPDGKRVTSEVEVEEVVVEETEQEEEKAVEKIPIPVVYIEPVAEEAQEVVVPQAAAVILSEPKDDSNVWRISLVALLVTSIVGIFLIRSNKIVEGASQ